MRNMWLRFWWKNSYAFFCRKLVRQCATIFSEKFHADEPPGTKVALAKLSAEIFKQIKKIGQGKLPFPNGDIYQG